MRLYQNWKTTLAMVTVACVSMVVLSGCASQKTRLRRTIPGKAPVYPADSHMVFNPDWSGLPVIDVPRADWPATYGGDVGTEEIGFSVRVIDFPAQFNGQQDQYSRRFSSTRKGKNHR